MSFQRAAAALALYALTALPASSAPIHYPRAVLTDVGGGLKFAAENDPDALLCGVQIFISAGLERQPANANGIAALLAEMIVRTPIPVARGAAPMSAREAAAQAGGSITYTVEGRSVHYYVEARSEKIASLVDLFSKAIGKPDLSPSNLAAARKTLIRRVGESEGNPLAVGIEMFKQSYYLNGAGMPALGSVASLERIDAADVAKFYADTYKRAGMALSAVGRVEPALTSSLRGLAAALPDGPLSPLPNTVKMLPDENGTRIVAQRDVGAPFLVVGFAAPSPADKDFGAMLLLDALLANSFDRSATTTSSLVERTISAFYMYDSTPASFVVFVNGARVEPTLALRELLLVTESLASTPMQEDSLKRFKAQALGTLLSDTLTLADRSYLLGTLSQDGVGPDSMNAVLTALEQTTVADVQRVAKRYLQKYIVAIVLPRQKQQ
jgi:predicted Zn-dependent peptidase